MSKPKTVIGLTIGPVYKTLGGARKTIELWAASYTFSYLMKRIVSAVLRAGDLHVKFLQPYADDLIGEGTSAGLFPDRMMLESEGAEDFQRIKAIVQAEKERLGDAIAACFREENKSRAEIAAIIGRYFQTYLVEIPCPEKKPLDAVNDYLETAELQQVFKPEDPESEDYLHRFFKKVRTDRALIGLVFEGVKKVEVQSLEEIALGELKRADPAGWTAVSKQARDEDNYMEAAKKVFKGKMKKRHRYVAIVHADGDNVGKTVGALASPEEYQEYCGRLTDFQLEAVQKIREYGGLPIYAGGDDLLFFAPVSVGGERHVFRLAEALNGVFSSKLKDLVARKNAARQPGEPEIPLPALSFGMSISYYKYPLYEALDISRVLLFGKAKQHKTEKTEKNAIAVRILLHSGNYFGGVYSMRREADGSCADTAYARLLTMLDVAGTDENLRLNSLTYALERNAALLSAIDGDELQMKAFFDNSFNEDVHRRKELQPFWRAARDLVADSYTIPAYRKARRDAEAVENPREKRGMENAANALALGNAYSVLRIIHFLNQADED